VLYDDEVDVLYLSLGQPRPTETHQYEAGLLIEKDFETGEVVGVTVLDYEQKFRHLKKLGWVMKLPLPRELADFLTERSPGSVG